VFRVNVDDPHPAPWMRVMLSAALGHALFPHPQWAQIARGWNDFYPLSSAGDDAQRAFAALLQTMPEFVGLLLSHRPRSLRGDTLRDVLRVPGREPERLLALLDSWQAAPDRLTGASPVTVFAVLGQARLAGRIGARAEHELLTRLITRWALRSTQDISELCAQRADQAQRALPATALAPAH